MVKDKYKINVVMCSIVGIQDFNLFNNIIAVDY